MKHIAITGAGPAGAATALLLAQQGLKVTLVEQELKFERRFRGEGLMPAGLEALYQMGLKETFSKIPSRQLDAWDFYVGGQRRMRVKEPVKDGVSTRIINQTALLEAMVEQAKALPNFEFCPGWQVVDFLRDRAKHTVIGLQVKKSGQIRDILADAVIGADGRYSRTRKLAGLTLDESPTQFDVLWFKLPAPPSLNQETPFVACLQPESQFAFYPSWDGRLQIGWIVEKRAQKGAEGQTRRLSRLKDRNWAELFATALPPKLAEHFRDYEDKLEGPIFLDVQVGCCQQWSVPGLLLIGDAAHPMAPNRAQGINMALRDAIVVANHLTLVDSRNGKFPDEVFRAVQSERQPEIEAVQKMQLAEWRKVKFISRPGLPYQGFKTVISAFGRFTFAQNIWLHEQKGLREGVVPVSFSV